jgi:hypothetical protein
MIEIILFELKKEANLKIEYVCINRNKICQN